MLRCATDVGPRNLACASVLLGTAACGELNTGIRSSEDDPTAAYDETSMRAEASCSVEPGEVGVDETYEVRAQGLPRQRSAVVTITDAEGTRAFDASTSRRGRLKVSTTVID